MKIKVSDYIAQFLVKRGVTQNFTVPGGGAMHLNMSFGHQEGMRNVFVHHEQSAAMAAESYARVLRKPALVCCTTGPGGTNTLTGVLGAWLDSIPMIVISGQVRYATTARASGLPLRAMGDQEYDIVPVVAHMTKYAEMVIDPKTIKYHLEKALFLSVSGRPGPVWLDIPLDVQGAIIETEELIAFDSSEVSSDLPPKMTFDLAAKVLEHLKKAERPVINVGNGVRIAGALEEFIRFVDLVNVPVVNGFDSIDTIPYDHPLYVGRGGLMGDRPGNFAVQNSDYLLSIGSRLSARQVGYNVKSWAREAYVVMEDVDAAELKKPSIHVDLPIHADAKDFLSVMIEAIGNDEIPPNQKWVDRCHFWKKKYPVVTDAMRVHSGAVNPYYFLDVLSHEMQDGQIIVTGNGTACVAGSQSIKIKHGQQFIINSGAASMGYDLPASVGAALARPGEQIVCLSGDGSIQMNLQELQTIVFHQLPVKIFVINNNGYHSMRQTEGNLFPELTKVGVGPETGDLSFPNMERLCEAYRISYVPVDSNAVVEECISRVLSMDGIVLCELFCVTDQKFEPKSATRKLDDGTLISPPLEDLAPFLSREELAENMIIPLWEP